MTKIIFNPFEEYTINEKSRLIIRDKINNIYKIKKIIEKKETYTLDISKYNPYWNYRYKYQVRGIDRKTGEERWVDKTKYKILYPEQINQDGMKYLLFEEPKNDKLIVIFQAINKNPSYNYVGTLSAFNVNKLFIKDDYGDDPKTKSSYYLGKNKNLNIAMKTQKLIHNTVENLNINKKNIIFMGSSKGGYAALYHGYQFGASHIVAGGPQILLGDYLKSSESVGVPIFESVIGDLNKENMEWANNLLYDVVKKSSFPYPETYIHVGLWEPHFEEHVLPFAKMARENNINGIELNLKDYTTHNELALYFPEFAKEMINKILNH